MRNSGSEVASLPHLVPPLTRENQPINDSEVAAKFERKFEATLGMPVCELFAFRF